tara:strand:+ start:779 stop:1084 length:306 start_codon:yes stop_codon:yes gene_type:complete
MSKHTPGPWVLEEYEDADTLYKGTYRVQSRAQHLTWGQVGIASRVRSVEDARLIAAAPELDAYRQYIEDNLERIERGGWAPVCFDEFRESEECANYMKEEA